MRGSTLVVEFPSENELLFLVNWLLFVPEREHPSGRVSQREGAIISGKLVIICSREGAP